ncbi:MAG: Rieske (2Fe-2S) protein [Polyangiaceae bacterium]|nr:Rieske (2Fe-2S) protein [Polyangiaceae bacterium]
MTPVIHASKLWDGEMLGVRIGGVPILIARVDDAIVAYRDACPHLGVALSDGTLSGTTLTCSAHGWTYDVTTGHGKNPLSARLRPVRLEIRDDTVFVDPGEEAS